MRLSKRQLNQIQTYFKVTWNHMHDGDNNKHVLECFNQCPLSILDSCLSMPFLKQSHLNYMH